MRRLHLLTLSVLAAACSPSVPAGDAPATVMTAPAPPIPALGGRPIVAVAVGDAVCQNANPIDDSCHQGEVAVLVDTVAPDVLFFLGDLQYPTGALADFRKYFEPAFGRFRAIIRPVPGNHEYLTPDGDGYFDYFNGLGAADGIAGNRARGYYSFEAGRWHVVAINSNCDRIGGCAAGSAQERWLRGDLLAHPGQCILAYWHHARFSSGGHGDSPEMRAIWQTLENAGADLVLAGHDHDYERFAPQRSDGARDDRDGIRSFVVGTGGFNLRAFGRARSVSEVRFNDAYGVLRLTLDSAGYSWRFLSTPGGRTRDEGEAACHLKPASAGSTLR